MRLPPGIGAAIVATIAMSLWLALCDPGARGDERLVGTASIIEADIIEIRGEPIRLLDLDAPEADQLCQDATGTDYRCGEAAALALASFIGQSAVTCDWAMIDRDERKLARCTLAGRDLGLWLIAQGWALPENDCKCEVYRDAADRAKARRAGIWAGRFDLPWDWRQTH